MSVNCKIKIWFRSTMYFRHSIVRTPNNVRHLFRNFLFNINIASSGSSHKISKHENYVIKMPAKMPLHSCRNRLLHSNWDSISLSHKRMPGMQFRFSPQMPMFSLILFLNYYWLGRSVCVHSPVMTKAITSKCNFEKRTDDIRL